MTTVLAGRRHLVVGLGKGGEIMFTPTRPGRASAIIASLLAGLTLCHCPDPHAARAAIIPVATRPLAAMNGPLVVLDARAGVGPGQAGAARILTVQGGQVARVLAREQAAPSTGGIAPSPRGLYIAYATNRSTSSATSPQAPGLWQVSSTGGAAHFIVPPPTSTQGNRLEIGSVAWSPDRYTLAYAVVVPGEGLASPQRERALGVWLTRYDQGHPRQLARNAQLGITSGSITRLSWTPDGRTLAVSTFLPARGGNVPVVLAVDASSGRAHTLVHGGQDATISPTTGALAYTISTAQMTTLWVAGAQGQQPHALVRGSISSPAWAPDGRVIAYLDHPNSGATTVVRIVNVATGHVQTVIADNQTGQPLLLADGHFQSLGWLRARA